MSFKSFLGLEMENLDEIAKDPLKILDYVHQRGWSHPQNPHVMKFSERTRKKIEDETIKSEQYRIIIGYTAIVTYYVRADRLTLMQRLMSKVRSKI